MREEIINKTFEEERSLYHLQNADVLYCTFAGAADGESVLKESKDISVKGCRFSLRYPLWHASNFSVSDCTFDDKARAPVWYGNNGNIAHCDITAIKMLRECKNVRIWNSTITSAEFGWKCDDIHISDSAVNSEYLFFDSQNISIKNIRMTGKYSFQYIENMTIADSILDTKDAFWHSKNVTVRNSVVKGEYLGWFSENLTLIDCTIIGTQPLCYCKNLKIVNCTMDGCDLSFEYSEVDAKIKGYVESIKNPKSGRIEADKAGSIIREDAVFDCNAEIVIGGILQ